MTKDSAIIHTDRLYLRLITDKDVDNLLELFGDPVATQFFPGMKNKNETIEWINKVKERYENDGYGFYACIKKEEDTFIGYCGLLLQKDVDGHDEKEVGYGFIRKYWHYGYATEAAIACKNYGFNHFGFEKIISLIRPENVSSRKVAERNGMIVEKEIERWGYPHLVYMALNPMRKRGR